MRMLIIKLVFLLYLSNSGQGRRGTVPGICLIPENATPGPAPSTSPPSTSPPSPSLGPFPSYLRRPRPTNKPPKTKNKPSPPFCVGFDPTGVTPPGAALPPRTGNAQSIHGGYVSLVLLCLFLLL